MQSKSVCLLCFSLQQDAYFEERRQRCTLQAYMESIQSALRDKAGEFDALREENAKLKEASEVLEVRAGAGYKTYSFGIERSY